MPQSTSRSLVTIDLRSTTRRLVLLLPAIIVLLGSWFVVRWYIGDTVAEYAPDVEAGGLELGELAVKWAPGDPFVHWRLGELEEKEFSADKLGEAVREYQTAVMLSPNDYRYWMVLGRALEASGDVPSGERALRRAVELAPAYAYPRWYLGNLLIREGKQDEAFREVSRAAEANDGLWPQVFNLAWEVFGGRVDAIANAACPSAGARAQLAIYLAGRQKFDEAMRVWATIDPADRKQQRELGESLKTRLIGARRLRNAIEVIRDIEVDPGKIPVPEQFLNSGFETEVAPADANNFGWAFAPSSQAQMAVDHTRAHGGTGSLRIAFKAPVKLATIGVSQLVVVQPGAQYRFACYARTDDLRSGSTPFVEIVDAADGASLASSPPLPPGTGNWQPITVEFKTKPKTDGVLIRLSRASCGQDPVCPIFGTVWYDDFNLQRIAEGTRSLGTGAGGTGAGSATPSR